MAAIIGKIIEKEMLAQIKKSASRARQDPLQYGFMEECSPTICALMVTEAKDLD